VETTGVYQTINLVNLDAACIASSIPSRIGLKQLQLVVAIQPDFLAALDGRAAITPMFVSAANSRTVIGISAPVWADGKVIAVVRAIIDMAFFDDLLLKPAEVGSALSSGIIDPHFVRNLSEYYQFRNSRDKVIKAQNYLRPCSTGTTPWMCRTHKMLIGSWRNIRGQGQKPGKSEAGAKKCSP
jgi:hypothetical protein